MLITHYAAAAKISKSSLRRWRDLIGHSKVEIDWRAQLHPSARRVGAGEQQGADVEHEVQADAGR